MDIDQLAKALRGNTSRDEETLQQFQNWQQAEAEHHKLEARHAKVAAVYASVAATK